MGRRKHGDVPARLGRLEQRFAAWRKDRRRGERIPASLWRAAVKLAEDYGLNQTAAVLKLDYDSLKRQVDRYAVESPASPPAFVQLPPVPLASECVIEWEDGSGASLRMHLKGEVPDVLALGRSFWDAE
jgi:hypothetical protein